MTDVFARLCNLYETTFIGGIAATHGTSQLVREANNHAQEVKGCKTALNAELQLQGQQRT